MTVSAADLPPTDPTAARDLAGVLGANEHVLWAGRPDERHYVRTDYRLIALGVASLLVPLASTAIAPLALASFRHA